MAGGQRFGIEAADFLSRAQDTLIERADTHGEMLRNHANVALVWSAYLQLLGHPVKLLPSDAAEMLGLLKLARKHEGNYNDDDDVDDIGYAAIAANLRAIEREQKLGASETVVRTSERKSHKPPARRGRR